MRRLLGGGLALVATATLATAVLAQSATKSALPTSASPGTDLPDLNPGEGWQEKETSAATGVQARAWSDPAAGCHLALLAIPVSDSVGVDPMRTSLAATMAKESLTLTDDTTGDLRITGAGIAGLAALQLAESPRSGSLLACYWNEREPARCQSICQRVLKEHTKASP